MHRQPSPTVSRRALLLAGAAALPWVGGCSTPLPLHVQPGLAAGVGPVPGAPAGRPATASAAGNAGAARLRESAEAHGLAAYRQLRDINIAYDGQWRPLIDRVQPVVVDKTYRGSSQERLLPALGINAQHYRGTAGSKHVFWRRAQGAGASAGAGARSGSSPGNGGGTSLVDHASVGTGTTAEAEVGVWFNGQRSGDAAVQAASALVAECYGLFLLGPLWLADRGLAAELAGTERVHGRLCDVVHVWLRPGLGLSALDRVALCIDRDDAITRRMRFTLEGFVSTRGAVAETDTFEHKRRFGVLWPMRSYEEVVHPLRLPAHDWHVTGLDVNRGYDAAALQGPQFSGLAAAPAAAL